MGVILSELQRKGSTVGYAPHRQIWGTRHRLVYSVTPHELRNDSSNYKMR